MEINHSLTEITIFVCLKSGSRSAVVGQVIDFRLMVKNEKYAGVAQW